VERSINKTRTPRIPNRAANVAPAGLPPMMITS
jgi:hypothetical protein